VPAVWSIVGLRDFKGDGSSDLLWRDQTGNTAIWFMNGTQISQSLAVGNVPTSGRSLARAISDGLGDILWRDRTSHLALWLMSGADVLSSASFGVVSTSWMVIGTGDLNGGGMTDIPW
jgi:hypothetical protein